MRFSRYFPIVTVIACVSVLIVLRWTSVFVSVRGGQYVRNVDPAVDDKLCGPRALAIALGRIGISVSPGTIANECELSPDGVALGDLLKYCNRHGVSASIERLRWSELKNPNRSFVLFVNGNHFVAAEPGKAPDGQLEGNLVAIYDYQRRTKLIDEDGLKQIWNGESLSISRPSEVAETSGMASVRWESTWDDLGELSGQLSASHKFHFTNCGRTPISMRVVGTSCGCTRATVTPEIVRPGESGVVTADLNLSAKRGLFEVTVLTELADSEKKYVELAIRGAVDNKQIVFPNQVEFGAVPRTSSMTKSFILRNADDMSLIVSKVFTDPEQCSYLRRKGIDIRVNCAKVVSGERSPVDQRELPFTLQSSDYVGTITIQSSSAAELSTVASSVFIKGSLHGKSVVWELTFSGAIVSDVSASPPAIVTKVARMGDQFVKYVDLVAASDTIVKPTVESITVPEELPIAVTVEDHQADSNHYSNIIAHIAIRWKDRSANFPAKAIDELVLFHLTNGDVVRLPVIVMP